MTDTTTASHDADKATRADVWDMAGDLGSPVLITPGHAGPHSRPMHAILRPETGLIWFLTDRRSSKEDEIGAGVDAALAFGNGSNRYLTMTGRVTQVDDRDRVKDLWSVAAKAYYPDGPEDRNIIALCFTPQIAELWKGPAMPVALVQMAIALATGSSNADKGTNAVVDMQA